MIKQIHLSLAVAIMNIAAAQYSGQNYTISPYSNYGLGELTNNNFMQAGSASQTYSGAYGYSLHNPATAGLIRYTSFDFGVHGSTGYLYSGKEKQSFNGGGLNYIALGFNTLNRNFYKNFIDSNGRPARKVVFNLDWNSYLAISPITTVGYNYVFTSPTPIPVSTAHTGTGGLDALEFGHGLRLGNHFHVGYSIGYVFGLLGDNSIFSLQDSTGYMVVNDYKAVNIRGMQHQLGMLYRFEHDSIVHKFGASAKLYGAMRADQNRLTMNLFMPSGGGIYVSDTILDNRTGFKKFQMPAGFGFGYSLQWRRSWSLALDYRQQMWGDLKAYFSSNANLGTRKDYGLHFVLFPEEEKSSAKKRMPIQVRIGGRYSQTQNVLTNNGQTTRVDEAMTYVGFGIPLTRRYYDNRVVRSMVNLQFGYLQRGVNNNGLAGEEYLTFGLGFNLGDIWFQKRKFD